MVSPLLVCMYCGTMPEPVTLSCEDGTAITESPGSDHAVDCPYYAFPTQPVSVPGPGLFGR